MSGTTVVLVASALLLLGVVASRVSSRLGIPGLLVFLAVGMLAGSDGPGGIDFDNADLAQTLGVVALAFILFAGGISTVWDEVRPVLSQGAALATFGVLITALLAGLAATWAFDLPIETGLLIGAIISSTDAAAVFSVLRSRSVSLRGRLRPLLELESGSNDPMAVFLTIGFLELVTNANAEPLDFVPLFVSQMAIGGLLGFGAGRVATWGLNQIRLDHDGLYPVLLLAIVGFTFSATTLLNGSGFLAVYVAGIVMAQRRFIHKNSLTRFHDGIAWVAQIGMFVVLGLLVFPSELPSVAFRGLLVAAVLIFVARPDRRVRHAHPVPGPLARPGPHLLGRSARCGTDHPRHVPADGQRPEREPHLRHRVLHRADIGAHPRNHDPARGQVARCQCPTRDPRSVADPTSLDPATRYLAAGTDRPDRIADHRPATRRTRASRRHDDRADRTRRRLCGADGIHRPARRRSSAHLGQRRQHRKVPSPTRTQRRTLRTTTV